MTATVILPVKHTDTPLTAARVCLKPHSDHPGMVNGAWWPRSRDLTRELPALIAALDERWATIIRVTVNVRMWPAIPKRMRTGAHVVRVGWFDAEQDPHDICLLSYRAQRWDLLVIPPQFDPVRAARLMALAADPTNKQTASALIATVSKTPPEPIADAARIQDWESEGGLTPEDRRHGAADPAIALPANT